MVTAVGSHHEEEEQRSLLSQIIAAANTLSSARPGARRAALAAQLQRLEDLEECALEFEEVEQVFAFKAGQEPGVIVDNAKVDDQSAVVLAREPRSKNRRGVLLRTRRKSHGNQANKSGQLRSLTYFWIFVDSSSITSQVMSARRILIRKDHLC